MVCWALDDKAEECFITPAKQQILFVYRLFVPGPRQKGSKGMNFIPERSIKARPTTLYLAFILSPPRLFHRFLSFPLIDAHIGIAVRASTLAY